MVVYHLTNLNWNCTPSLVQKGTISPNGQGGKAVKHDEANCILRDTNGEENPRGITMFRMKFASRYK